MGLGTLLQQPPEYIVERYSVGGCVWLALALHDRYGWQIVAQVESKGACVAHAYVRHPLGFEIDICGPQDHVDTFAHTVIEFQSRRSFLRYVATTSYSPLLDAKVLSELSDANRIIDVYIEPILIRESLCTRTGVPCSKTN